MHAAMLRAATPGACSIFFFAKAAIASCEKVDPGFSQTVMLYSLESISSRAFE
jgi:hypothetical protein